MVGLVLNWRHLCGSREDAHRMRLRWAASTPLVEANVTTGWLLLLLLMMIVVVVVMVPIDGMIVAPAMVVLTDVFLCVRAIVARPVAEPNVADWEEERTAFWAVEDPMALIGPVAFAFSNC